MHYTVNKSEVRLLKPDRFHTRIEDPYTPVLNFTVLVKSMTDGATVFPGDQWNVVFTLHQQPEGLC